jgi:fructokinase
MYAALGEALVDLIEHSDGRYEPCLGGAVCNFTRAAALQGQRIRYLNPLSTDTFGQRFAARLQKDGVEVAADQGSAWVSALPTSLAVVSLGEGGVPHYVFHRQSVADRDCTAAQLIERLPADLAVLHTGGLALMAQDWPKARAVLMAARARGAIVSVDANLRPVVVGNNASDMAAYLDAVRQAMAFADVLKLSDEDIAALGWSDLSLPEVAAKVLQGPTRLVALTLGEQGAMLVNAQGSVQLPVPKVPVVDTVGAGDCFQAGLLAYLSRHDWLQGERLEALNEAELGQALRHAMAAAAINVQRQGCLPPTWDETRAAL